MAGNRDKGIWRQREREHNEERRWWERRILEECEGKCEVEKRGIGNSKMWY